MFRSLLLTKVKALLVILITGALLSSTPCKFGAGPERPFPVHNKLGEPILITVIDLIEDQGFAAKVSTEDDAKWRDAAELQTGESNRIYVDGSGGLSDYILVVQDKFGEELFRYKLTREKIDVDAE